MKRSVIFVVVLVIGVGIFAVFKWSGRDRDRDGGVTDEQLTWPGRIPIYEHVKSHLDETGKRLTEAGDALPDQEIRFKKAGMRWASGARDGAVGHHFGAGSGKRTANKVADLVVRISRGHAHAEQAELYDVLVEDGLLDYVDPALEGIAAADVGHEPYLHQFARYLATKSPDRGPVKFAIALLGLIADDTDRDVITLLGRHEEFTLYSAVALTTMSKDPEGELWDLAKNVHGWGRIALVERLTKTKNPAIKQWLLVEGYKNNIMYGYSAYDCATAGDLRSAMTGEHVDDALVSAAGDMIEALATGGPGVGMKGMNDYKDAAAVVRAYLKHVEPKVKDLQHYLIARSIQDYLNDRNWDPQERRANGWDETIRLDALTVCGRILGRPEWRERATEGLKSNDESVFHKADKVAQYLGIDTWETRWRRLREKPLEGTRWLGVMHDAGPKRIHKVVSYAMEVLPLDKVATGPAKELGLGKEYQIHRCLDFIYQLGKYPGVGWPLIAAALKSPVISNRNAALDALSRWGKDRWPPEVAEALRAAESAEPDEEVKETIRKLIAGQPLEPPQMKIDAR
jgi:hypothetical protein